MQRNVGIDSFHDRLRQCSAHAGHRLLAGIAVHNDLADHGVVVRRHKVVGVHMRIYTHTRAARRVPHSDASRRRDELVRILGIHPALDGVTAHFNLALGKRQLLAGSHHDLRLHDIDARHHFSDRMLHLNTGVHFNKVELTVFVEEFEGSRSAITDLLAGIDATFPDAFNQLAVDARRGGLFQHLLVTALHRAIALAEVHRVLVLVREDLDFNVPRVLEKLLHVHRRIVERRTGFRLGHGNRIDQRGFGVNHTHTASATATCRFDNDRIAH